MILDNISHFFNNNILNFTAIIFFNKYLQQKYLLQNRSSNNISCSNITPFSQENLTNFQLAQYSIDKKRNEKKDSDKIKMYNDENKYIMISSNALSISCLYALFKKNYNLSSIFGLQYLVANKYWKNPTHSMRKIDVIVQRSCLIYHYIYSNSNFKNFNRNMASNMLSLISIYFYKKGCQEYDNESFNWYKYHMLFHIVGCITQIISIPN